jgi:UDP-N-acetylglucosamine--N-acetylmuramyl-(pentapeptide) pyrophosphoryl-undecaprenol N-acetylglucosamine transferase
MRILIAGGGTGGHLYPGIAVARAFRKEFPDCSVLFVGTREGLEAQILPEEGFPLETISIRGFIGKGLLEKGRVILQIPAALMRSHGILRLFRPHVVIGVGGYASGPLVLMAVLLRIPTLIMEQNYLPGMTNRVLSFIVDRVAVSFEGTRDYFKRGNVRLTGNPVRPEIYSARNRKTAADRPVLLVFGGSRGAHAVNRLMVEALPYLSAWERELEVIHQTGVADFPMVKAAYEDAGIHATVSPYLTRIQEAYQVADLVIARAGATTVAELAACALPAILIPFPQAVKNHQLWNARALQSLGAAEVIPEKEANGKTLSDRIITLVSNRELLRRMGEASRALAKPDAAAAIVEMSREIGSVEVGR